MQARTTQKALNTAARQRGTVGRGGGIDGVLAVTSFAQARWVFVSPSGNDINSGMTTTTALGLKYEVQHLPGGNVLQWERTTNT